MKGVQELNVQPCSGAVLALVWKYDDPLANVGIPATFCAYRKKEETVTKLPCLRNIAMECCRSFKPQTLHGLCQMLIHDMHHRETQLQSQNIVSANVLNAGSEMCISIPST